MASVGPENLYLEDVLNSIPEYALKTDSSAIVGQYINQWVMRQVLVQEAVRSGIMNSGEFQDRLKRLADETAMQMLLEKAYHASPAVEITREEAIHYYNRHRDKFVLPERFVRFHHMYAATIEDANQARQELLGGVEWDEIVDKYAVDPAHSRRNSEMFHPAATALANVPAMNQFLRVIGITEVSQIRLHEGNYHFVQLLEDRQAGEIPELDWALVQIQEWLSLEKKQNQIRAFEQTLLRKAEANREIVIYD